MNWIGVGNNNIFGIGGGYPYQGGSQGTGGYGGGGLQDSALREYPKYIEPGAREPWWMNAGAQSQPYLTFNTWGAPTTYNPYTGFNNTTGFNPNIFGGTPPPNYFNNTTPWWQQQQQQQQQPTAPVTQPAAVNSGNNDGNIMGTDGWNTPKLTANEERHRDYTDAFRKYKLEEDPYATWSDYDRARGLLSGEGLGKLGVSDQMLDRMVGMYNGLPVDMFEPNWQGNEFTKLIGQGANMFLDKFNTNYPEEIQNTIDDYMGKENWTIQDGIKSLFSGGTQAPAQVTTSVVNAFNPYVGYEAAPAPVVSAPTPVSHTTEHLIEADDARYTSYNEQNAISDANLIALAQSQKERYTAPAPTKQYDYSGSRVFSPHI